MMKFVIWFLATMVMPVSQAVNMTSPVFPEGKCVEYPSTGACAVFGLAGKQVYIPEYMSVEEYETALGLQITFMKKMSRAVQGLSTATCTNMFSMFACTTWFPTCDDGGSPQRVCKKSCQDLHSFCALQFQFASRVGGSENIPTCDEVLGSIPVTNPVYPFYNNKWIGEPAFESDNYVDAAVNRSTSCLDVTQMLPQICVDTMCPAPMIAKTYPLLSVNDFSSFAFKNSQDVEYCANTENLDCSRCFTTCEMPCPYPGVFSHSETTLLWFLQWFPGMLALPMSALIVLAERKKLQRIQKSKKKKKAKVRFSDRMIEITGWLCILLFLIDSFPAMILKEDMRCAAHDTYTTFMDGDEPNGTPFCVVGKFRFQITQSIMFAVGCMMFKVRKQLEASVRMKKYILPQRTEQVFIALIFFFPLLSGVLTIVFQGSPLVHASRPFRLQQGLDSPDFISLYVANNMRFMYSCGPFFNDAVQELLILSLPLLVGAAGNTVLAIQLLMVISKFGSSVRSNKTGGKSALYRLAISMLRFAAASVLLSVLNMAATAVYLPNAEAIGDATSEFARCISNGVSQADVALAEKGEVPFLSTISLDLSIEAGLARCGLPQEFAPSMSTLILLTVSQTLSPLAFAFVFFFPAKRSFQQRRRVKPTKQTTTTTGTTASSTSSVSSCEST